MSHVASVVLPAPATKNEEEHSNHRGGRKAYHQCGAVITELKKPAGRLTDPGTPAKHVSVNIKQAQIELFAYCKAYFACHSEDSVIAFAAAGPFWKWASVSRGDVPGWSDQLDAKELRIKQERFDAKFGKKRRLFVLGTEKSDVELTKIREACISMVSKKDHTPKVPILE